MVSRGIRQYQTDAQAELPRPGKINVYVTPELEVHGKDENGTIHVFAKSGGQTNIELVDNFASLPPAGDHTGELWYVRNSTGIWPFRNYQGLYYSDGGTWNSAPPELVTEILENENNISTNTVNISALDVRVTKLEDDFLVITEKDDFPAAVGGVITLADETTYFINAHVDLTGDRLVLGDNTTILGASSENSSLTSTGLGSTVALITTNYAFPFRHLAIKDVGTALDLDGTGNIMALDWTGINFVNVETVGIIKEASNFIFNKGALINSQGLKFDGTTGTIALDDSLLSGDPTVSDDLIELLPTCVVTRRFRTKFSAVVASGLTSGINVDAAANVPTEGFIMIDVNFAGGGTYLPGIDHTDNKTLFRNCVGIVNTSSLVSYYMNGNGVATVVSAINTPYKMAGATSVGMNIQKFTHSSNRATYNGKITRQFLFIATCSVESGNNNQIGVYLSKNGVVIPSSEVYGTTSGSGRGENIVVQALVEMSENDYIEVWTENSTSTQDITVTDLHLTGTQI